MTLDKYVAVFFLLVSLIYGYAAINYPLLPFERNMAFLPNTMPMVLGVLGAVFSLIILLTPKAEPSQDDKTIGFETPFVIQAVLLLLAMVLFAICLRPVGFIISTTAFLIGCGAILGERKFHFMIPISAISAFGFWYLVQEVLGIYMRPWPF